MPVELQMRGSRLVYVPSPWPAECKLRSRPQEELTDAEIRAELKLLDNGSDLDLHKHYCTNPECPARR